MNFDELECLYDRIILGLTIVTIGGKTYYIHDPEPIHRALARHKYDNVFNDLLLNGLPTKEEIERLLVDRSIWNEDSEKQLKDLSTVLETFNEELLKSEFRSNQKALIENKIEEIQFKIDKLESRKYTLLSCTVEYIARMESYKELIYLLTYDLNNKRIWTYPDEFNAADDKLIQKLVQEVFFNQKISETSIRKLARSEPWRSTWLTSCKTGNLFNSAISQMTDIQRALVSWSLLYDSVFENPDKPSDDVIQNDKSFDNWLKSYHKNKKSGKKESFTENNKISNSSEVAIMTDSMDDAQAVYNLNDKDSLKTIESREKVIIEKGTAKDADFSDVKLDLQMRKNVLETEGIKGRRNGR